MNCRDKNTDVGITLDSYTNIVDYLNQIPQYMPLSGVERARCLLEELGHPEHDLKILHVAGTNGKGSTCAYLNQILLENGYSTGLFTSPHLVTIRERIQIAGRLITEEEFVKQFQRVHTAAGQLKSKGVQMAYFDYLFGMAMCFYCDQNADFVVMETGLGGRLDATNAIETPIISIITTISLEHTAILGDTLGEIAKEKAGIIKKGIPVVYSDKHKEVSCAIEAYAVIQNATGIPVSNKNYQIMKNNGKYIDFSLENEYYKNDCFKIATSAIYQVENCSLALTALMILHENHVLQLEKEKTRQAVLHMHWAGRMEEVAPQIYVDGAHNPEGIEAFIASVKNIGIKPKSCLLFSAVKDKNFEEMIRRLCECNLFQQFVVTQVGGNRQLETECMEDIFKRYTKATVVEFEDVATAFEYAQQQKSDILLCTGSLYLVGDIKSLLKNGS